MRMYWDNRFMQAHTNTRIGYIYTYALLRLGIECHDTKNRAGEYDLIGGVKL